MNKTDMPQLWIAKAALGFAFAIQLAIGAGAQSESAQERTQLPPSLSSTGGTALDQDARVLRRQELTRSYMVAKVARDFDAAWAASRQLWVLGASATAYEGQWDQLISMAVSRTRLALEQDDLGAAWMATHYLFLDPSQEYELDGMQLVETSAERHRLEQEHLRKDSRLGQLRIDIKDLRTEREEQKGVVEPAGLPLDDPMVVTVQKYLQTGSTSAVTTLGVSALPALESLARHSITTPSADPRPDKDPLKYLYNLSPMRTARIAMEGIERGGAAWSLRLLVILNKVSFDSSRISPGNRSLIAREWGEVVDRMLRQPAIAPSALKTAVDLRAAGYKSHILPEVILNSWESEDVDLRSAAYGAFEERKNLRPVAELLQMLIRRGGPELSSSALRMAQERSGYETLRPFVDDTVSKRRLAFAEAIELDLHNRSDRTRLRGVLRLEPLSAMDAEALHQLATDQEVAVRRTVARIMLIADAPDIGHAIRMSLCADPDVENRLVLARSEEDLLGVEHLTELLVQLADSTEHDVLHAVDLRLVNGYRAESMPFMFDLLRKRLDHPTFSIVESLDPDDRAILYKSFVTLVDALPILMSAAVSQEDPVLLGILYKMFERGQSESFFDSAELDALIDPFLRLTCDRTDWDADCILYIRRLCPTNIELSASRQQVLVDLAQSRTIVAFARAACLSSLVSVNFDVGRDLILPTLASFRDLDAEQWDLLSNPLSSLRASIPREQWPEFLRELLAAGKTEPRGIDDRVIARLLPSSSYVSPALARSILDRFESQAFRGIEGVDEAVGNALRSLIVTENPTPADVARVSDLLHRDIRGTLDLAEALGTARGPAWFDLLRDCLQSTWVTNSASREELISCAILAMTEYLSEEAGEVLLEAARSMPTAGLRQTCSHSVEVIHGFLLAEESFFTRRAGNLERGGAVDQLVSLLNDEDSSVRIEALRALATMKAVETFPLIIEQLRSKDEGVQKAAREALERLNELDQ
ncbi:MAG: hypothetical protein ACI8X5_000191 [Planctomycetota bacterium]|jgi:hypothetical protein